jgi:OPT family oligopeptide transporter
MSTSTPSIQPVSPAVAPVRTEYELPINGFTGTPDEIERQWFEKCYKGRGDSMLQLTARAVIMGSVLGGLLSVTNIYIGLKAGWGFGVSITACILSYAIWTMVRFIGGHVVSRLAGVVLVLAAVGAAYWVYPAALGGVARFELAAPWPQAIAGAVSLALVAMAAGVAFGLLWRQHTAMTILENNCMQTAASAAGYSTGGTLISAFAAYILLTNQTIPIHLLMGMVFFLAILGVTMAIPMKRQMINHEQLKFPSGVAAAETLKALYSSGSRGIRSALALGVAGIVAMCSKLWLQLGDVRPEWEKYQLGNAVTWLNERVVGHVWMGRTVNLSWDLMFIAAGAITGMRVCVSMMIGAVTCWMVFVPILQHTVNVQTGQTFLPAEIEPARAFPVAVQWTLWAGTGCMVTSGLLSFFLQWKSALKAFAGLGAMFGGKAPSGDAVQREMDSIETPAWWFVAGQVVGLVGLTWLTMVAFQMLWWQTTVAVLLSFVLAIVACRVTGETDTTPIGAMGKIMQLTFAGLAPGNMVSNLMAANVTAGSAGSSAALLTDLKSGYLLGAHPRKQFLAQFSGIFVGTIVTVLVFSVLVPNAQAIGTGNFPAPAALTWKAVAEALGKGIGSLHPLKVWSMAIGGALGVILPVLGMVVPKKAKPWIPSAAGLGLAWTFPFYNAFMFFVGAIIGWILEKKAPKTAEEYTFTVASGLIAGESLMGSGIAGWQARGLFL